MMPLTGLSVFDREAAGRRLAITPFRVRSVPKSRAQRDQSLVSGADDSLIPEASARLMEELTPEPKTVIRLEGGHIRGGRTELARTIVAISRGWLLERGAINPW